MILKKINFINVLSSDFTMRAPVSYTHLDVYKRQIDPMEAAKPSFIHSVGIEELRITEKILIP